MEAESSNMILKGKESFGGAYIFSKEKYSLYGMENEEFVSHAPEDVERRIRVSRLGGRIGRINGCLYHLHHYMGIDSRHNNPHKYKNYKEFRKVSKMNKEELSEYVSTWNWL